LSLPQPLDGGFRLSAAGEVVCERDRLAEGQEMPSGEFLDVEAEAIASHTPLQRDREQSILPTRQHRRGNVRPPSQRPGLAEDRWPFGASVRIGAHDLDQIRRKVVKEQSVEIADIRSGSPLSFGEGVGGDPPADLVPPFAGRLAWWGIIALTSTSRCTRT
jgi:hypothetical protein